MPAPASIDVQSVQNNYVSLVELFRQEIYNAQKKFDANAKSFAITTNGYGGCFAIAYSAKSEIVHFVIDEPEHLNVFYTEFSDFTPTGEIQFPDEWKGQLPEIEHAIEAFLLEDDEDILPIDHLSNK